MSRIKEPKVTELDLFIDKLWIKLLEQQAAYDKLTEEGYAPNEAGVVLKLQGVIIGLKMALEEVE